MQHFIQASTTSGQTGGGDAKADDFQQESTFVKMMLDKKAKQVRSASKFCHNSDLKITKCMQGSEPVEIRLWKTLWKVWNSTRKTGLNA